MPSMVLEIRSCPLFTDARHLLANKVRRGATHRKYKSSGSTNGFPAWQVKMEDERELRLRADS